MRGLLLVLVAASTLASGCLSNAATDHDEKSRPMPPTTTVMAHHGASGVSYSGCTEVDVAFPIPMDDVASGLPEGFAPIPFAGEPTGQFATALVWSTACRSGHASGHPLEAPTEMWAFLPVTVPDEYQAEGLLGHLVALGAIMPDGAAARTYASWGFGEPSLALGSIVVATSGSSDSAARAATVDADTGNFSVAITASAGGLTATNGGGRVRAYILEDGEVRSAFDNVWSTYTAPTLPGHATAMMATPAPVGPIPVPSQASSGFGTVLSGVTYTNQYVPLNRERAVAQVEEGPAKAAPAGVKGLPF